MAAGSIAGGNHAVSRILERYGIIGVVLAMMLFLHFLQPDYFFTIQNLMNVLRQIANNALLSLGMFLVILTAGIDLSVGAIMVLSSVVMGQFTFRYGLPAEIAVVCGLAVGTLGIAQTLVILTAGIDLSVGAIMVLSSIVMARGEMAGQLKREHFDAERILAAAFGEGAPA